MSRCTDVAKSIRTKEFELIAEHLSRLLPKRPLRILEIGSGKGESALALTQFGQVVAVDPYSAFDARLTSSASCAAVRALAENLPFQTGGFDVVFSNSVLEHVPDLDSALREMRRVAKDDAIFVHVVPTIVWKTLAMVAYYRNLCRALVRRLTQGSPTRPPSRSQKELSWRANIAAAPRHPFGLLLPPVHGTAPSHLAELRQFRLVAWRRQFANAGYIVRGEQPLLTYSPPEFDLLPPSADLARLGFPSSVAFYLRAAPPR